MQETHVPALHMYGCGKDCLIFIPFRLPQINCYTLSLRCFSSDSDSCPDVEIVPLLQFPHPPRASPVLLILLFSLLILLFSLLVPSSYRFLHGPVYSFPLVRYSAGVQLSTLSWCSACISLTEGVFIPDVSVERDVLHVHLLLRHLVLPSTC